MRSFYHGSIYGDFVSKYYMKYVKDTFDLNSKNQDLKD